MVIKIIDFFDYSLSAKWSPKHFDTSH
jgi:hypothetical protein